MSRIYDLANSTLAAVIERWPMTATELPERQYVIVGTPAADCEQVTVAVERTYAHTGDVALEQIVSVSTNVAFMRAVALSVGVIRCVPVQDDKGDPPAAAEIDRSAQEITADADAVLECLIVAQTNGELAGCGSLAFEGWDTYGPEGGLSGGFLRVRMAVE